MEGEAAQQRATIAALASTLDAAGVRFWLMGGWAVDTHLGRTTRRHSDIDLAVLHDDRPLLLAALGQHGLVSTPGGEPAGELFDGGPVPVEITYLVRHHDGAVVTPGFEHWPWHPTAFVGPPAEVDGVTVPIVSVAALIDTKANWESQIGEPPRPHDLADLEALRQRDA